jgi:hypothetical protein
MPVLGPAVPAHRVPFREDAPMSGPEALPVTW